MSFGNCGKDGLRNRSQGDSIARIVILLSIGRLSIVSSIGKRTRTNISGNVCEDSKRDAKNKRVDHVRRRVYRNVSPFISDQRRLTADRSLVIGKETPSKAEDPKETGFIQRWKGGLVSLWPGGLTVSPVRRQSELNSRYSAISRIRPDAPPLWTMVESIIVIWLYDSSA
jgi:hypothetical protein